MGKKNTDDRRSSVSPSGVDSSINKIVDHLTRLSVQDGPGLPQGSTASFDPTHLRMLRTLQKAINFAPILHATKSEIVGKPQSVDSYIEAWKTAGSPKLTVQHCNLEDDQDEVFCIWLAYEDLVIPPTWRSLQPTPEPSLYRIKKTTGFGQSMIANRSLSAGELIVIDRPILITPLVAAYLGRDELEQCLDDNIQFLRNSDRKLLNDLHDCLPNTMGGKWRRIRLTNAVSVEFPNSKHLPHYGAVFPIVAKCNHSCGPNSVSHFDHSTLTIELRAARNIEKGEEITVSYCYLLNDHKTRQKELLEKYKFTCTCTHCTLSKTCISSNRRRERIRTVSEKFSEKIWWSLSIDRIIKIHKDVLDAIEEEGIQTYRLEHVRWLVRAYAAIGDVRNTRYWAREAANSPYMRANSPATNDERHLWFMVSADVTRHPDWNSRNSEAPIDTSSFASGSQVGRRYTELQESVITAAEAAYQNAGEPTMGRVVPWRDYHFCIWIIFEDLSSKFPTEHVWGVPSPIPQPPPYRVGLVRHLGSGLLATKHISVGSLIVSERPIVLYPADFFNINFPSQTFSQEQFSDLLEQLVPSLDEREYAKLMDLPEPDVETIGGKIYRIVTSNSLLVKFPQAEHVTRYCGVFPTLARCNHSCAPNAAIGFDSSSLVIELRALRPINPGEEITITYCDLLQGYTKRQKELSEIHGFKCKCQHCITHADDSRSDERRAKILSFMQNEIASTQIDLRAKARRYEDIMRAIEEENLQQYRFKCIIKLSETYAFMGDLENATKWIKEGKNGYVAPVDGVDDFQMRSFWQSAVRDISGHPLFS